MNRAQCDRSVRGILLQNHELAIDAARHMLAADSRNQTGLWPWGRLSHSGVQGIYSGGKGGRCVELTTLPSSCADCLEIWEPQPPCTLTVCAGITLPFRQQMNST